VIDILVHQDEDERMDPTDKFLRKIVEDIKMQSRKEMTLHKLLEELKSLQIKYDQMLLDEKKLSGDYVLMKYFFEILKR